jgi:branched-chain amino acid transport system ATP-binding protein
VPALETISLIKKFGGITATDNVSLAILPGARHALIGPNGAGKTTFVNQLTGVLSPSAGRILLAGEDITTMRADRRVSLGLARTFQINQLFQTMSPREALTLALLQQTGGGGSMWRSMPLAETSGDGKSGGDIATSARDLATRFRLDDVLDEPSGLLPYGRQRQLEIALALATKPRVLLLDEPAAGVPEAERRDLLATIAGLPADITVLLIEHDMDIVFRFADRITVLVNGALFADGEPTAIAADPRVRAAYLGDELDG